LIIDSQPQPTIVSCVGEDEIVINISATGDIYDYVWRKDGIPVSYGNKFSVSEQGDLLIKEITENEAGSYDVVISSPEGSCSQIISNPALLTVNLNSADPVSATVLKDIICLGETSVLTLNGGGAGTDEVINWYTDSDGSNLQGTGNELTVEP